MLPGSNGFSTLILSKYPYRVALSCLDLNPTPHTFSLPIP